MQWILGQTFPGELLYGIPEFFFEAGLMWVPSGVIKRRRSTRPLSESQLPSWSFLGWQGTVHFVPDGEFYEYPSPCAGFMIGVSRPITTWYTMTHPESSDRRQIKSDWHDFKVQGRMLAKELPEISPYYPVPPDFALPPYGSTDHAKEMEMKMQKFRELSAEIPKGWALVQLGASSGQDRPADTQDFRTANDPLESAYQYDNSVDHTYYRYPVPVHREATQHAFPPPTQFLSCKTSRAFFHGVIKNRTCKSSTISGLYLEEKNIGFVALMSEAHEGECAKPTRPEDTLCELVAISEGWACLSDEADDVETGNWSKSDRRECYHVLYIGWDEGIAYRRGIGCVLKETWKDIQEAELVDLIL
ncbi:hypothetical protein BJ166DRAFT_512586, partial [Pestalotiopsis sp. NC0098]